jgi:hypothetical protein
MKLAWATSDCVARPQGFGATADLRAPTRLQDVGAYRRSETNYRDLSTSARLFFSRVCRAIRNRNLLLHLSKTAQSSGFHKKTMSPNVPRIIISDAHDVFSWLTVVLPTTKPEEWSVHVRQRCVASEFLSRPTKQSKRRSSRRPEYAKHPWPLLLLGTRSQRSQRGAARPHVAHFARWHHLHFSRRRELTKVDNK